LSDIVRIVKRRNPFVQVDRQAVYSKIISFKAKGILTWILAHPDSWKMFISTLVDAGPDGKDSIRSGVKELIDAGYIERKENPPKDGKFCGYTWTVYEAPDCAGAEKPQRKNRGGKPATINNNTINNKYKKKDKSECHQIFNTWSKFVGVVPFSRICKVFPKLFEEYGKDRVCLGFIRYVRETEIKFVSPEHFAGHIKQWLPTERSKDGEL